MSFYLRKDYAHINKLNKILLAGGPLVFNSNGTLFQVGVVSFGNKAGCAVGFPGAFGRVSSFRDWIQKKTGIAF